MNGSARRIVAGMGANTIGQVVTIGIQLASLPLFLRYWDISRYGLWLMISAVPSYFSMADAGMVAAAGNEMTMAVARGDIATANRVFQTALIFMLGTCGLLALVGLPAALIVPWSLIVDSDRRIALCALILGVLLSLFGGLSEAIFRATGRYALGTSLSNCVRLAEWCGWVVGLVFYGSFASVALCGLVVRVLGLATTIAWSCKGQHGLQWRFRSARWVEMRAMLRPALSFMAFPLANALSFQGMTILTGVILGTSAVAVFNTYRTLARVVVQVTSVFSHALWTEFSHRFGKRGAEAIKRMYRRSALVGVRLALGLSLFLYLVGPLLLRLWTHGAIPLKSSLMLLMLIYAAVAAAWHVPRVLLLSTNEHNALAGWSLCAAVVSLLLTAVLCPVWKLDGAAVAMLVSEAGIALICAFLVQSLLKAPSVRAANGVA
jgi:O-antigen/teichoic acid export membrane protein